MPRRSTKKVPFVTVLEIGVLLAIALLITGTLLAFAV